MDIGSMTKFEVELREYLTSKFPDIDIALIYEAAACATFRTMIYVSDALAERDKLRRNDLKDQYKERITRTKSRNSDQNSVSQGEFDKGWTE